MMRRTHGEVARDARMTERSAVLALFARQQRDIAALIERGKMDAASASLLSIRLRTIGEQIEHGLHEEEGRRP